MFLEAIFFSIRENFCQSVRPKVSLLLYMMSLAYKFLIVFLPIIIQDEDMQFALVLHFLHRCYTFCTRVTLKLHCYQPIRIE